MDSVKEKEMSGEGGSNRRSFMKTMGVASAGMAGASLLGGTIVQKLHAQSTGTPTTAAALTVNDIAVLNFALNLEYLEAEFYSIVTTGKNLVELGVIPDAAQTGDTTGGAQVFFDTDSLGSGFIDTLSHVAKQITYDEQQHVKLLRNVLGSSAIKKPAINLDALHFGFANETEFLTLARAFEDVGVTAYAGAAPLIQSKVVLATAARIALTEAEHSGNIRQQVVMRNINIPVLDDFDIPPTLQQIFPVDSQGLVAVRPPGEVLEVVYGGTGCSGGFFPRGVNGAIKCTS